MPENRISDLVGEYDVGRRRVRLFRNGRNQAIRIPREMELPGEEAVIYQQGDRLIIEPVAPTSLLAFLASLEPLEEELPEVEDSPPEPVEL
jgi:antitoxin VapB